MTKELKQSHSDVEWSLSAVWFEKKKKESKLKQSKRQLVFTLTIFLTKLYLPIKAKETSVFKPIVLFLLYILTGYNVKLLFILTQNSTKLRRGKG